MADTVQFNVLVPAETKQKVTEIGEATHRANNDVIRWLVDVAYQMMVDNELSKTTVQEALAQPYPKLAEKPRAELTTADLIHRLGGDE